VGDAVDFRGDVWAVDIATVTGWCLGPPGGRLVYGSIDFRKGGGEPSIEARFSRAYDFTLEFILSNKPALFIYEAPLPTAFTLGKTSTETSLLLTGLVGAFSAAAYKSGIGSQNIWSATVRDVRKHFLGAQFQTVKREIAKSMTMQKCRDMGYDPKNDNEGDAIALHSYMSAIIDKDRAIETTPLFRSADRDKF
jgi:hypothetical protein